MPADFSRLTPAAPAVAATLETRQFTTLADYSAATGQDRHSVLVDYDIFVKVPPLNAQDRTTVQKVYKREDLDFRLQAGVGRRGQGDAGADGHQRLHRLGPGPGRARARRAAAALRAEGVRRGRADRARQLYDGTSFASGTLAGSRWLPRTPSRPDAADSSPQNHTAPSFVRAKLKFLQRTRW